jgi:ABC-type nitrate/sulfonate/bicarbonate transport system substrate-binding protein
MNAHILDMKASFGVWLALTLFALAVLVGCGPVPASAPVTPAAGAGSRFAAPTATVAGAAVLPTSVAEVTRPAAANAATVALAPATFSVSSTATVPPLAGLVVSPTAATGLTQEPVSTSITSTLEQGGTMQKATLSLDWVPNTNHTGFYVALDKGWYKDEGIDLDIQIPSDPSAALKQVAFGHTEFGVSFEEEVTIARSQKVPIVSIAAIIQHNTSAFAALKGKGVTRPKDFEGKKYATYGAPLEKAVIAGLMECDGGNVDKVEFVDVGFDAFPALVGGKADFAWIFLAWDGVQADIMNKPLDTVPLEGSCVPDYYTPVIISGETTLNEKPALVRRFMAATAKGYRYAIQHPDESAEILIKYSPETSPDLIRRSQKWLSPRYQTDAPAWGVQKLEVWQRFGKWMADRGLLGGPFKAEEAFTMEYMPQ